MLSHVFYKNLQERDKMYGLELVDLYILLLFFNLSFLVNSSPVLINFILTAILFFVLRIYKKNKPRNYTTDLVNYWRSKKRLVLPPRDRVEPYFYQR